MSEFGDWYVDIFKFILTVSILLAIVLIAGAFIIGYWVGH